MTETTTQDGKDTDGDGEVDTPSEAVGIKLMGNRGNVISLEVWDMFPTNPY